jgi:hypothetical protein
MLTFILKELLKLFVGATMNTFQIDMAFKNDKNDDIVSPANSFRNTFEILSQRMSTIEIYWCALTKKGYIIEYRLSHRKTRYRATILYYTLGIEMIAMTHDKLSPNNANFFQVLIAGSDSANVWMKPYIIRTSCPNNAPESNIYST